MASEFCWSSRRRRTIARISKPSAARFYDDFVRTNTPVIIVGAVDDRWVSALGSLESIEKGCADMDAHAHVHVNVTPDGHGDCVVDGMFVRPEEREMTFSEFSRAIREPESFDGVPYLSHQNDSLREEFSALASTTAEGMSFAREAFGSEPDAVNLWIGDGRAVSAVHKDSYENCYAVVCGEKKFTLLPPCDGVLMDEDASFPTGEYTFNGREWGVVHDSPPAAVPWIRLDPCDERAPEQFPLFKRATVIQCTIGAGECLYLPALWFHRVAQSGTTIAVNQWFECADERYLQLLDERERVGKTIAEATEEGW